MLKRRIYEWAILKLSWSCMSLSRSGTTDSSSPNKLIYPFTSQNPQLNETFYLPYAEFLVHEGKYEQAQEAYKRASRVDLALKILTSLAHNAIVEKRFKVLIRT